jgi:hypothetical protein
MIVVGVDAHKKTHTLVAVDPLGRRLDQLTIAATTTGHQQAANGCSSSARFWSPWKTADT